MPEPLFKAGKIYDADGNHICTALKDIMLHTVIRASDFEAPDGTPYRANERVPQSLIKLVLSLNA